MPSAGTDLYAQDAAITVVESAAGTLTFQQLTTGSQLFERRAMVIHRISYLIPVATYNLILDQSDYIDFGLITTNTVSTVDIVDPNVIDHRRLGDADFGTPANAVPYLMPILTDWTNLPGGGRLVPAFPIYGFVLGGSIASAATVKIRFQFTVKTLKAEEYIELVEANRVIT